MNKGSKGKKNAYKSLTWQDERAGIELIEDYQHFSENTMRPAGEVFFSSFEECDKSI